MALLGLSGYAVPANPTYLYYLYVSPSITYPPEYFKKDQYIKHCRSNWQIPPLYQLTKVSSAGPDKAHSIVSSIGQIQ
jgi:hypothetical protein